MGSCRFGFLRILIFGIFLFISTCVFDSSPIDGTISVSAPGSLRGRNLDNSSSSSTLPFTSIQCRLVQVEAFMLGLMNSDEENNDAVDLSHTSFACQSSLDGILYAVEFERETDASRLSHPVWMSVPQEWLKKAISNSNSNNEPPPTIVLPSGTLPPRQRRTLMEQENDGLENSQEDVAPADFTRMGRKTLLAVRIVTNTEQPDVDATEMEAAIFGTAPHPHANNIALEQAQEENVTASLDGPLQYQSVAEQFQAATLGNLLYQPLRGPGYENGVLELNLAEYMGADFVLAGQGVQSLAPEILKATAIRLGVSAVTNAADHVIFCLPNDSLLAGSAVWTAFTYLYEPYSYYQRSRCTKLSVVMHELGHSLGFRHSGIPTNAYADETGPMGYSVNQYGAPVKAFNSHKNWIAGWVQHYAVHLRRLNEISLSSKTTYVGRVAALADAPHVPVGKEVVLVRLGRKLFMQYNRAKGFHRQTGTPNTVTIVYAEHEEDSSTRVASLQVGDVYEYDGYPRLGDEPDEDEVDPDDNLGLVVALCRMGIDDTGDVPIDYAEVVVQWRDPLGPRAANLNLALCNLRNDKSAPVLNFGVAIDNDPNRNPTGQDTTDIQAESVNTSKQTVLLILGVAMAAVGVACLVASLYLVMRQCRMHEQQLAVEQQQQEVQQSPGESLEKPPLTHPESFETAQTTSFDSYLDDPPETPTVEPVSSTSDSIKGQDEVEHPPVVVERKWWEDIVDNLMQLASSSS